MAYIGSHVWILGPKQLYQLFGLGGVLEEVCHWRWTWRFHTILVSSFCFQLVDRDMCSWLLLQNQNHDGLTAAMLLDMIILSLWKYRPFINSSLSCLGYSSRIVTKTEFISSSSSHIGLLTVLIMRKSYTCDTYCYEFICLTVL